MADTTALNCPSCGAPLAVEHRFVRMVACGFCGSTCEISDEGLNLTGKLAKLAPLPTRFQVGQSGTLRGRPFKVLGRVRYGYDEGSWDEWYLLFDDGEPAWLEEDEGQYILSQVQRLRTEAPPFDEVRVGSRLDINGVPFMVTE